MMPTNFHHLTNTTLHLHAGFSINGWLTVLLTFPLARVSVYGTLMREEKARASRGRYDMALAVVTSRSASAATVWRHRGWDRRA